MALKWLKYAYKRQFIGFAPNLYWSGRRLLHGLLEPDLSRDNLEVGFRKQSKDFCKQYTLNENKVS